MPTSNLCIIGINWPCLPSGEWAAWVQAVGSVLALGIAVAIPVLIHRADKRRIEQERRIRARSYALALLPGIEAYASRVQQVKWKLRDEEPGDPLSDAADLLDLPPALEGKIIDIHELGSVGSPIQDALALVPRLQRLINDHDFYWRHGGIYYEQDGTEIELTEPEPLDPLVQQVDKAFELAVHAVRGLFRS
jgi:hypothetical protein